MKKQRLKKIGGFLLLWIILFILLNISMTPIQLFSEATWMFNGLLLGSISLGAAVVFWYMGCSIVKGLQFPRLDD